MILRLRHPLGWIFSALGSRQDLILENLALRQQLLALHTKRPRRRLAAVHKMFWVVLRRLWAGWKQPLLLVTPRTVVDWHRAGFRLSWKWLSRAPRIGGRKPVSPEIRTLIFRMAAENHTWGAPRIHGELLKLGVDVSEPTVSRWLRQAPRTPDPAQRWLTFLRNHRDVRYYHEDRTHLGLAKDTPAGRPVAIRSPRANPIQSWPRLGGLHHRYAEAA